MTILHPPSEVQTGLTFPVCDRLPVHPPPCYVHNKNFLLCLFIISLPDGVRESAALSSGRGHLHQDSISRLGNQSPD